MLVYALMSATLKHIFIERPSFFVVVLFCLFICVDMIIVMLGHLSHTNIVS